MLTLDDVLKIPTDANEDHLRSIGLLPPAAPATLATPGIIPSTSGNGATPLPGPVAKMTPPTATTVRTPSPGPAAVPPEVPAMQAPAGADLGIKPMELPKLDFKERQALPSTSEGVAPGSPGFYEGKIAKIEDQKENPLGSPENHPGFGGKLAHVLGLIGNIAGNATIPGTMAMIPGTELNRGLKENAAETRLETAKKEEVESAREKSEEPLREAQAKNISSETKKRDTENKQTLVEDAQRNIVGWQDEQGTQHSLDDPKTPDAIKTIAGQAKNTKAGPDFKQDENGNIVSLSTDKDGKTTSEVVYHGNPKVKTETKEILKDGKPHAVVFDVTNPNDKENFGKELKDLGETKVPPEPGNYQPVTDKRGNTAGWVDPKSRHFVPVAAIGGASEAAGGAPGAALPQKPTTQMRNVGAQAQVAVDGIPDVIKEVNSLKEELGPVEGRWNDFMQGKIGMDNPKFSGLRADLLMLSSAVALAHARGRLPENLREEFDSMINAPKQTADNIVSVINHIEPWMKRMSDIGISETGKGAENVPDGKTSVYDPQGNEHFVLKDKKDAFLKDPKYKGWTDKTPEKK